MLGRLTFRVVSSLSALAEPLARLGGVWLSVRSRPFGRGGDARFWFPDEASARRFLRHVPTGWEVHVMGHLRHAADLSYDGVQVGVTVPAHEIAAARRVRREVAAAKPELAP